MECNFNDLSRQWNEQGYVIVRGLIDPDRVARLAAVCEEVLQQWLIHNPLTGLPGDLDARHIRNPNNPVYHRSDRAGLIELLELAADEKTTLRMVRQTTGCQNPMYRLATLWFNPRTKQSDGEWHRDPQYQTKTDEEEKRFIFSPPTLGMQLQLALLPSEDSQYVPASHLRWDTPEEYRIRKGGGGANACSNDMPDAIRIRLEPGDAVAFNSRGLHRGRYHIDKPRRTYMLTYTSEDQFMRDHFIMQPWFLDPDYLAGLSPGAERFFRKFIETFRQDWLASAVGGR